MGCAERLAVLALGAGLCAAVHGQPALSGAFPGAPAAVQPALPAPLPAGRWTVVQVQQAFERADANADGQLTRAEAQYLAILPRSFEELDANKDGVLTRGEYEAGAR